MRICSPMLYLMRLNSRMIEQDALKRGEVERLCRMKDALPSSVSMPFTAKNIEGGEFRLTDGIIISHCAAKALSSFPLLNSRYAGDGKVEVFDSVNLGVAVTSPKGLVVPVIVKASLLTLEEFAEEYHRIVFKAFTGKTTGRDYAGGTFTVTDLSALGVTYFTPRINLDQTAILGIGRNILNLTFDHRVTNGYYAAEYLSKVEEAL